MPVVEEVQPSLGRGLAVLMTASHGNISGVIQDIQPHAIRILLKQALREGTKVAIEFGAVCEQGEIISCRPRAGKYEICVTMPGRNGSELRTEERFPMSQAVRVGVDSSPVELGAVIVDLSVRGIGLEVPAQLEVGGLVTVETDSNLAFGIVRHCKRLVDDRYRAGIEVFHVTPN
jgi:hypothetical protein